MYGFIAECDYKSRSLVTSGIIQNPSNNKRIASLFIWDTGASVSAINEDFAKKLELNPISFNRIGTANGERDCSVYFCDIVLEIGTPNKPKFSMSVVGGNLTKGTGVLIGMDIIRTGSFLVHTNTKTGRTFFEFFSPSLHQFVYPNIEKRFKKPIKPS